MIETYGRYTPEELRSVLLNTIDGDAHELHCALIVLCQIVDRQQAKIDDLVRRINQVVHP